MKVCFFCQVLWRKIWLKTIQHSLPSSLKLHQRITIKLHWNTGKYLAKTKGRIHRIPVTLTARTPNHQQLCTANVLIPLEYESQIHPTLCFSGWYLAVGQATYKMYCFLFAMVSQGI